MEAKAKRPLSPHLQIYKPQITSILSIMHRITGVILIAGTLLMTGWLLSAANGPEAYRNFHDFFIDCFFGKLALIGWTWAFCYHLLNGIRHLFWDLTVGLNMQAVIRSGWTVLISSVVLTGLIWCPSFQNMF